MIILESDGAQTRGEIRPLEGARQAKAAGIRVEGIALGRLDGKVAFGFGAYNVPPDRTTVAQVAAMTGGRSVIAPNAERLKAIYTDLASSIGR